MSMAALRPQQLISELQSHGFRLDAAAGGLHSRRGGAGPSDHAAILIDGQPVMVPLHTGRALHSPFVASRPDAAGAATLSRDGQHVARIAFARPPRFYRLQTLDGVPYSHIATLHSTDVLATTVLQTCTRYQSRAKACQFCSIGQSLAAGRTIAHKTPGQLAEVARAAVLLDGVRHMVLTTGTPPTPDRGARVMCDSATAIRAAVDLPLQAQFEPPDDFAWFRRVREAGVDSLGMHLEVLTPALRQRLMPGKAAIPPERYDEAFAAAVEVFGRGQVSTYILAGLGDSRETILAACARLIDIGVYPFVVPFVPISGTPLEDHPAPDAAFMDAVLAPLAGLLQAGGLSGTAMKAGCGKCGACSAQSRYEARP
ncbi:MSMEG_0568 family radical SAM protein [Zoogloea sp. LCSB751]|uniref:MSMEG_0568 family radical SAM protein n=1 Tax=Zoogloea sp. LCSB751 TaxID=1965277 RepID=UPI0009A54A00|nr:MSMEG_0568 family radical SAM protein [Zoogloea sp. LCSB751]